MGTLISKINKVIDFVIVGVGSGFLILLTTLTFIEVFTRYILGFATAQVSAYCVFFLVWLSFATAGVALRERRHIAMTTLGERLVASGRRNVALYLDIFIMLMVIVFACAFSYIGIVNVKTNYLSGVKSLVEYVPRKWLWNLALPVGTVTLLYYAIQQLVSSIWQLIAYKAESAAEKADRERTQ